MQLLDRQRRLLEYLTSGGAIFRDRRVGALDPALQGMARDRLDLEARFSHEKRMEKIGAVFPRTIALLGDQYAAIVRAFADACPPHDLSRIANARQLQGFLATRWKKTPAQPPYLPDVAACELACAEARLAADDARADARASGKAGIRRRRDVVLLRCAYDIRAVFASSGDGAAPIARETCLAVSPDAHSAEPRMLELAPEVLELIAALDAWTDPTAFEQTPGAHALIAKLAEAGLLEIRH
jgi:hypothetical protein